MLSFTPPTIQQRLLFSEQEYSLLELYKNAKKDDIFKLQKKLNTRLIHQLFARQVIADKLPFFANHPSIVFPEKISQEQASSEVTAAYKASLFQGKKFADLTGGFGIDAYFFAKRFDSGFIIERNTELAEIVSHNLAVLNQFNVQFAIGFTTENFLQYFTEQLDLIYIDPARRNHQGGKVVLLQDCEPDVVTLQSDMLRISSNVLIKTSPLLDIVAACSSLKHVRNVYVIAVNNECKELLFHLERGYSGNYQIHAINLNKDHILEFSFSPMLENQLEIQFGPIDRYIYEPNAAIMKAGGFKSIAQKIGLVKLHPNTHLYTSNELVLNFPGRTFTVEATCNVDRKQVQQVLPELKANVSIRNFPGSAQELKRKLGLNDGGESYIFGTTNYENKKVIIITKKL